MWHSRCNTFPSKLVRIRIRITEPKLRPLWNLTHWYLKHQSTRWFAMFRLRRCNGVDQTTLALLWKNLFQSFQTRTSQTAQVRNLILGGNFLRLHCCSCWTGFFFYVGAWNKPHWKETRICEIIDQVKLCVRACLIIAQLWCLCVWF